MASTPSSAFTRKLRLGFSASVLVAIALAIAAIVGVRSVSGGREESARHLMRFEALDRMARQGTVVGITNSARFLLGTSGFDAEIHVLRSQFGAELDNLERVDESSEMRTRIDRFRFLSWEYAITLDRLATKKAQGLPLDDEDLGQMIQKRDFYFEGFRDMFRYAEAERVASSVVLSRSIVRTRWWIGVVALGTVLLTVAVGIGVTRALTRLWVGEQNARQARDRFLSIASHELKTPLTPMLVHLQALRREATRAGGGAVPAARLTVILDRIVRQEDGLVRIVDEVLDVARLTGGEERLTVERQPVEWGELVSRSATRFGPEAERRGERFELALPASCWVLGEPVRLSHIVDDMLGHAMLHGEGGLPVSLAIEGGWGWLRVRDTGERGWMETRFEEVVSERHYKSFGLGLWVSRQVLEAMGGSLEPTEGWLVARLPLAPSPIAKESEVQ